MKLRENSGVVGKLHSKQSHSSQTHVDQDHGSFQRGYRDTFALMDESGWKKEMNKTKENAIKKQK